MSDRGGNDDSERLNECRPLAVFDQPGSAVRNSTETGVRQDSPKPKFRPDNVLQSLLNDLHHSYSDGQTGDEEPWIRGNIA